MIYKLRKLHGKIHDFFEKKRKRILFYYENILPILLFKRKNPKGVFLVYTPEHGNLGDHAIAVAEKSILDSLNISYYEISGKKLIELRENKCIKYLNKHNIIINGGGLLGTIWFSVEKMVRDIITNNMKSKIIIFPNTVFYEDTDFGNEELKNSIQIYNSHPNLYIYAREKYSYNTMKDIYNNVKLVPDVVLSLDKSNNQVPRNGCILCFREDCEKTLPCNIKDVLINTLSSCFDEIFFSDMDVFHSIPIQNRETELEKKYEEFKSAELVVTDRLHCMIFCAITETPCIVLNSLSPKVKGCYEWIKELNYIRFVDDIDDILKIWAEIKGSKKEYSNQHLQLYFEELKKDIIKIINS